MNKIIYTLFIICISSIYSIASAIYNNAIYSPIVKSIEFHASHEKFSSPVLFLNNALPLSLQFDVLGDNFPELSYSFIFCDKYWQKSNLMEHEYLLVRGILDFPIIEHSINTAITYTHFSTSFPNEQVEFLLSGNYILQVTDESTNAVLFQLRFIVAEQLVNVQSSIHRPTIVSYMDTHQAIDVEIFWNDFPIYNPTQELYAIALQNNRWDTYKHLTNPSSVGIESISYKNEPYNYFYGNADFWQFNFKNFKVADRYVQTILFDNGIHHIYMVPNKIQAYKPYTARQGLHGNFFISHDIYPQEAHIMADYAAVYFSLEYYKQPYDTLDAYIIGGFNNWTLQEQNKMQYHADKGRYESKILLKQGYYDYMVAFASADDNTVVTADIEGSHYQTNNNYEIILYYTDILKGYDRIIAYHTLNSL